MGSVDTRRPSRRERVTVEEVGELLVANLRARGRKRATIETYDSLLRVHLGAVLRRPHARSDRAARDRGVRQPHAERTGSSPKTTRNALGVLHSIFEYARREELGRANPCTLVDKPRAG